MSTVAPDGFPLRTRDVAFFTGIAPVRINRYAANRVIPGALRTQRQSNGLWWFQEEAVDWVLLINKLTAWRVTESQIAEYFASAISKCGTAASALASLNAAYQVSKDFAELKKHFEDNKCLPGDAPGQAASD